MAFYATKNFSYLDIFPLGNVQFYEFKNNFYLCQKLNKEHIVVTLRE